MKNLMKPFHFTISLVFATVLTSQVVAQTGIQWEKDLEKAKARATAENKPLLLHFYGDSCPPCQLMERDVFPKAKVIEKMNADFVAVKIDTSRSPQLMSQYQVRLIPTDVYLSPTGEKLYERVGLGQTPMAEFVEKFVAEMNSIAARFPKPQPVQIAQPVQNTGVALAEYHQPNMPQPANQDIPAGLAGYSVAAPLSQEVTFQPQVQPASGDSEGFAVSGGNNGLQENTNLAAQLQQLQTAPGVVSDNPAIFQTVPPTLPPQQFTPQTVEEQQIAATQPFQQIPPQQAFEPQAQPQFQGTTQPLNVLMPQPSIPGQDQPVPQYPVMTQNPLAQQNEPLPAQSSQSAFVASATSAIPSVPVGSFENGMVRKQPTTGLGAGNSLGVVTAASDKPVTVQPATIAFDGYCPVSLAQTAKWIKGNAEITTEYDGVVFRFASVEAQKTFAVNPGLYAPVLRGNDVVELLTSRREMAGQRKFGAWYHGHVFLFANADNYEKFQNNPELYAFQAQQVANTTANTLAAVQRSAN